MAYIKLMRGDPAYEYVQALKRAHRWVCDSLDHNEPEGCSNPDCFKWNGKDKIPATPA